MSIFIRLKNLWRSRKAPKLDSQVHPLERIRTGDILTVDLTEYLVTGKIAYYDKGHEPHRYAYYLREGNKQRCLLVDKGRVYDTLLLDFIEGSLDNPNNVPSLLVIEDERYNLEYYRTDRSSIEGFTDFRTDDTIIYWRFAGKDGKYFILQWQDGKYVALQGSRVPEKDVTVMAVK